MKRKTFMAKEDMKMGNIIAVYGTPESGKTTIATKLCKHIYEKHHASVILLGTDNTVPVLPLLFPDAKQKEIFSLGQALSKPEIRPVEVTKNIITPKGKNNLGVLGYANKENKYSYPAFDETKALSLLRVIESMADFVVVDCASATDNVLMNVSLEQAQKKICLATPDLKAMVYLSSQLRLYPKANGRVTVLNRVQGDIFYPVEESKAHMGDVRFQILYCRELKEQFHSGELLKNVSCKKFNESIAKLSKTVM